MSKTTVEQFDALKFLDDLIEELGMQDEDEKRDILKERMAKALHDTLFRAAANNIEPETIDMVMDDLKDEKDAWFIMTELMQTSPSAQVAMLQALEDFRNMTLEVYKELK